MSSTAVNVIPRSYVHSLDQNGTVLNKRAQTGKSVKALNYETFKETLRNMEAIDLAEKYSQQAAEAAENPINHPGIDLEEAKNAEIADFSSGFNFDRPESKGDAKTDKVLELLYDFYESCFDTTHADEFFTLGRSMDFTGMTNAEKYKAIYEKYQYCFGENFLDIIAVQYGGYSEKSLERDPYWLIYQYFCDEIESAIGSDKTAIQKARIEALYGERLSSSEVRQKIIDKYYYEGMTLRDLMKMAREMNTCGVDPGLWNLIDEITINRIPFGTDFSNFQ